MITRKHLTAVATFLIATLWGSQSLPGRADNIRIKSTLQPLNALSALPQDIDKNNSTWKSEPQLVAQSGSMQDAVNFIHRLRKEGKIEIGTDNTYYFGDVQGRHLKIGTTGSGMGPYSNWVILTEMPADSGYGFRVVGDNSYEFLGVRVNGQYTHCPGSCPILNAN